MDEQQFIELIDEEGNTLKLEHLITFENNDAFYAAFLPCDEADLDEEADEVVIMRLEEDERGEETFLPVDDDEELDAAWQAFLDIYYEDEDEDGKDDEDDEDDENDENDENDEDDEDDEGDEGDPGKDELGENR